MTGKQEWVPFRTPMLVYHNSRSKQCANHSLAWWEMPTPSTQEDRAVGSFKPRSLRSAWAIYGEPENLSPSKQPWKQVKQAVLKALKQGKYWVVTLVFGRLKREGHKLKVSQHPRKIKTDFQNTPADLEGHINIQLRHNIKTPQRTLSTGSDTGVETGRAVTVGLKYRRQAQDNTNTTHSVIKSGTSLAPSVDVNLSIKSLAVN